MNYTRETAPPPALLSGGPPPSARARLVYICTCNSHIFKAVAGAHVSFFFRTTTKRCEKNKNDDDGNVVFLSLEGKNIKYKSIKAAGSQMLKTVLITKKWHAFF
eukprot:GEMP01133428.1.p1 GENE.GEMP01133428.1~~GEMP01133428.1.p1  ORF type:complete len:118 (-),score=1.75 GEMP01133428.1:155-466(-)